MADPLVIFITAGSAEEGERIAEALVKEMLAACVNIVPAISSVYRWEGRVQRDNEALLIVKSRQDVFDHLVDRVKELHSYDLPEVIALPIAVGSDDYLRWLSGAVQGEWHAVD